MIAKNIGAALRALAPAAASAAELAALATGVALISYGAWEAYRPAGPMVAGALLLAGVILRARGS